MSNVTERKCARCKGAIVIERGNISDVIYHEKKYYHEECFCELCNKRIASKRGNPAAWQDALDSLWELEAETRKMLEHYWAKDDLNVHLLKNYNVTMVPTRFWQIVADLEIGKYKGKNCKSVDIETLYGCWKWGQRKLNEIDVYNKKNHKGPTDDNGRLMYDLSIIISKIPNYMTHVSKMKAIESNTTHTKAKTKINYDNLEKKTGANDMNDISDLLDDIFEGGEDI